MTSTGLTGATGFAFWLIVARLYTPEQVGAASALISAVILIAYLSQVGLDITIVRFMSNFSHRDALVSACLGIVAIAAVIMSAVYVELVPRYAPELSFVRDNILFALGFCIIGLFAAVNLMTDWIFVAARRPEFNLLTDGILQGLFKLVGPLVLVALGAYGIFLATGLGYAVASVASLLFMWRALSMRWAWPRNLSLVRRLGKYSSSAYAANVFQFLSVLLLPLIALHSLGAAQAGFYYIAYQVANLVNAISYAVGQSVFSEGSHNSTNVMQLVGRAARMLAVLIVPTVVVLAASSSWILHVVGAEYAQNGNEVLRLLLVACLAVAVNTISNYLLLFRGHMNYFVLANGVACVVVIWFAASFAAQGLIWLAVALMLGNLTSAVIGFVPLLFPRIGGKAALRSRALVSGRRR
jgi:O-antigen/teichoic acid export membrane protein